MTKSVTIYEIAFSDGTVYVGQTSQSLASRINKHTYKNANGRVYVRLNCPDMDHAVSVLAVVDPEDAIAAEKREIALRRNLLNFYTGGDMGRQIHVNLRAPLTAIDATAPKTVKRLPTRKQKYDVYPPKVEEMRCSRCRVTKPAHLFPRDRCRWNGLHSRCKQCSSELWRERYLRDGDRIRAAQRVRDRAARARKRAAKLAE